MKALIIPDYKKPLLFKRNKPNYDIVKDLVYYVHRFLCKNELPIDLSFMYEFQNLRIKTYSWFAKLHNMSIEKTIDFFNSDSGCCYYMENTNQYLIFYNDLIKNPYHNRWTLAHELGHYLLKHNEICDKAILGRSSIGLKEYNIYEQEANAFARELLAPLNVLYRISSTITYKQIMQLCDLSSEASKNIIKFAKTRNFYGN